MRQAWEQGDRSGAAARIVKEAEGLLDVPIPTIVDKKHVAPSGDPRDYYSLARYWWPNPVTRVPYIRRDGHANPEIEEYDSPRFLAMNAQLLTLAKAFGITGDPRFARKAGEYLKVWFVDPKTRMNPHLNYAQAVKGLREGSPWGIVDAVSMARSVPPAVELLRGGKALDAETDAAVQAWFREFLQWLEESPFGRQIAEGDNNISTWYDMQRASYALLLNDIEKARTILKEAGPKRIGRQIAADGSQPRELKRTRAFDYSCYNLNALITLCELGDGVGVDLWHYEDPKGGSIARALDWLIPYAEGQRPFPYKQLKGISTHSLETLLKRAAPHYPDKPYGRGLLRKAKTAKPEGL